MPETVRVTIDVPAPPEGLRVDSFRHVQPGEMFFCQARMSWTVWDAVGQSTGMFIVAIPITLPWSLPASLAPGWVTVDSMGAFHWKTEPMWMGKHWASSSTGRRLYAEMFRDLTPWPICGEHAIWKIE